MQAIFKLIQQLKKLYFYLQVFISKFEKHLFGNEVTRRVSSLLIIKKMFYFFVPYLDREVFLFNTP